MTNHQQKTATDLPKFTKKTIAYRYQYKNLKLFLIKHKYWRKTIIIREYFKLLNYWDSWCCLVFKWSARCPFVLNALPHPSTLHI
ncbi:unnamed protein product [Blepharisma stoltei]|uniref:Uncharacterized protein n=1 Tax=Blepharisma stoltei TaxID=1481888 RepID=A0AAU9K346_9CILI|nr:unnamed protein product [Blepharisma stoltei]